MLSSPWGHGGYNAKTMRAISMSRYIDVTRSIRGSMSGSIHWSMSGSISTPLTTWISCAIQPSTLGTPVLAGIAPKTIPAVVPGGLHGENEFFLVVEIKWLQRGKEARPFYVEDVQLPNHANGMHGLM